MADGSISMADGLGLKAIDSNEVRRRQQLSGISKSPQFYLTQAEVETQMMNKSSEFKSGSTLEKAVHATSPAGFGAFSPKSAKNPSPSRKLQQVFEEALVREAEDRASKLADINTTLDRQQGKVQVSNPNSQVLFNAKGNPYLEGDPNLGYSLEDLKPRYSSRVTGFPPQTQSDPSPSSNLAHSQPKYNPLPNQNQTQQPALRNHPISTQTHQINPKSNNGQTKPKPRNWAALLQFKSPSLDMKLDYFPDLQRGKEAMVEIDIELTEIGKWNRYLVGHFLDGRMAYPLLVSTARNQWKDLFVAVKPNVAEFFLFEFKVNRLR